ncbi:MAG: hypothetical protein KGQ52_11440 [Alphaproteobacteria bacterium]|nr:hypothetical protein [Alphaproteobacteria bacterium]
MIQSDADFDRRFIRLETLLSEIESAPMTPALLLKIREAEQLNGELFKWVSIAADESIETLISLSTFMTSVDRAAMISEIIDLFPEKVDFIVAAQRRHGL